MESPSSVRRVMGDVIDLCELQMQLLSVDAQSAQRKLTRAVACGATAAVLAGSALTAAVFGGGYLLHELTELTVGVSMLIVSGAVFVVVAIMLFVAISSLNAAAAAMSETKSEFAENLRWLKATLISPETSARNQLRDESFPRYQTYEDSVDRPNGSAGDRPSAYPSPNR
ncbi:phage holin family protein [Roseiconus nitratireducens]|uniref:Phage holin family protein n=1 Tax=Roseiconus nitratireducens TaxID=2605748 RepID=A0A5M6DBV8_9BACT|nr:phage holin family protein [Roseiconus nitratireducens]KAA5542635.1 phage holin family protein [Roseiconus nitratireducens]